MNARVFFFASGNAATHFIACVDDSIVAFNPSQDITEKLGKPACIGAQESHVSMIILCSWLLE